MINALWLCLIPIIWALVSKFALKNEVTWKEAGAKAGVIAFVVLFIFALMSWSNTSDTQIINGQVTGKEQNRVSCSHSYQCRCRTVCSGSGSNRSCSTHCDTCYEHPYDWDWDVYTSVGNFTISRVDRRGSDEPPRWTAVRIGEPAAREESYTNYVKAAPNSLFNMDLAEKEAATMAALIPGYPQTYDYYRVNHTLSVGGANVPTAPIWDALIDDALRSLGAAKQVNILVVFVKGQGREYANVLERAWVGGKKNDVVVVVGTPDGNKIEWVESFTFGKTSGNGMLAVQLRDNLQAVGSTSDAPRAVGVITKAVVSHFKRKEMADFEYLREEGGPTATQIGWLVGITLVLLGFSTWFVWKNDLFGENRFTQRFRRY